jgi:hypothetical protein
MGSEINKGENSKFRQQMMETVAKTARQWMLGRGAKTISGMPDVGRGYSLVSMMTMAEGRRASRGGR